MEIIIGFWFLYFWDVITNPQKWANAENVASFLPISRLSGESWRKGKLPKDPYFFSNIIKEGAVYGIFYPPNVLVAYIGSFFSLRKHFNLLVLCQLLHYLFGAIGMYLLTGNVICGLLWGFGGHMMRPEPCLPQTLAWFPWVLMFPFTIGFMILAGFVPVIAILMPLFCVYWGQGWIFALLGIPIGLPVILPILSELKGGIRKKLPIIGKVPFWHLPTLLFPILPKQYINGVGYWEMNYYLTPIIVLAFFSHNWFLWGLLVLSVVGMRYGCKLWGDRVASRISISMVGCLIFMFSELKLTHITYFILTCLVMLWLYPNRKTLPVEVFDKANYDLTLPKLVGNGEYRTNNIPKPWSQGQLHKIRSVGYVGSHSNERFVLVRGGNCGSHNIFDNMEDGQLIDFMGVRWHYGKRPSRRWIQRGVGLWENLNAFPREFMVRHYVIAKGVENVLKRMCEVDLRKTVVLEEEPKHKEFIVTNDVYDNHPYRGNLCFGVYGI